MIGGSCRIDLSSGNTLAHRLWKIYFLKLWPSKALMNQSRMDRPWPNTLLPDELAVVAFSMSPSAVMRSCSTSDKGVALQQCERDSWAIYPKTTKHILPPRQNF